MESAIAIGNIVTRQPLIRWTQPISDTPLEVLLALELSSSKFTRDDNIKIENLDDERFPDMVFKLNTNQDWGNLSLSGMARQIRLKDAANNINEASWGGAISLAGKVNIGSRDNIRFMLSYGDALARYIGSGAYADASFNTASKQLDLNTIHSGTLFYQHYWNAQWRSNLALGYSQANLHAYVNNKLTKNVTSANINLMWSPLAEVTFGLEYLHAMRELENGQDGDLNRLLFSSRFNF